MVNIPYAYGYGPQQGAKSSMVSGAAGRGGSPKLPSTISVEVRPVGLTVLSYRVWYASSPIIFESLGCILWPIYLSKGDDGF